MSRLIIAAFDLALLALIASGAAVLAYALLS